MRSTLEVDWPLMQNGFDFTAIAGAERTYDQVVAALDAQYGSSSSNGDTGIEGVRRDASISTRDAQYYASRDTSWASALSSSTSLGTSPWIVKERTSANSQAAYSTNRANAQATHDAALLSAIDNWQTSNRASTLSLLLAEGQSREAYNKATASVYANWEMGIGNLLGDKPAGTDWSALGYTGAEQPSGSVSSRKETGRYVQLAAWQDNKEGQAKNDKPAENGLPPRPTTVSVSLDDSIMKGDFDFTPDEFEEFQRQLLAGEIKLTDVPLMLEGMHPALIKFISENPEVYKELTRKYGFEYQHKLNALFKNNNDVVVGYRGYFDPAYNIEAGRVYLDNGSWYFFTASAQTQADRLKDLIDRVGEIEGNDEVRSPILTPGDIASWFNPDRSVRNNLDYVEPEIEKIVKDLAWELAGEVIQEATGAKLAAAGGSAAIKGGTQAVAAASNTFAAFIQWRKYKRLGKLDAPNTKSGTLTFNHTVKAGKPTDVAALRSEIQLHVDAWNEILQKEGMAGLKRRLQQWEQFGDDIEAAGRKYTKSLGSAGEGKVWPHYPDMATGGRPKSAVGSAADRRLNSIIGGQADRLRREILTMPDDVTRLDFNLDVK
jgi:hypothetical protein